LAINTGQKVGQRKDYQSPKGQHGESQDYYATLGAGLVDRGAYRRLRSDPEQAANRGHHPDFG
jgi:hypothetical protein